MGEYEHTESDAIAAAKSAIRQAEQDGDTATAAAFRLVLRRLRSQEAVTALQGDGETVVIACPHE